MFLGHTDFYFKLTHKKKHVSLGIIYIAFCIEDSLAGRDLFNALEAIASENPDDIQFGSVDWLWERHLNVALQI